MPRELQAAEATANTVPTSYHPAIVDEFHGQGGSYVFDPVTGKRSLIEQATAPSTATEKKD